MENRMQLWEVLKGLTEGAYICGDTFTSDYGEIIYVDIENNLVMNSSEINTSSTWEYVHDEE